MNINKFPAVILAILLLESCIGGPKDSPKLNQYMVEGMQLYRTHCTNCHQVDGTGLARLIPPLNGSDYLKNMVSGDLACQIRYGLRGEIMVNDIGFNQEMPGIPNLTPLEIAEIITYVNNTWGDKDGLFEVKAAEKALNDCNQADL